MCEREDHSLKLLKENAESQGQETKHTQTTPVIDQDAMLEKQREDAGIMQFS